MTYAQKALESGKLDNIDTSVNWWDEVISCLDGYDEQAMETADPSCNNDIVCFKDGSELHKCATGWHVVME